MDGELYQDCVAGRPVRFDLTERALWSIKGEDRLRYLGGQITNDIRVLQAGAAAVYAAVTNAKGRMIGDLFVSATCESLWADAPAELRESMGQRLEMYLIADDVELTDVTPEWQLTHITGNWQPPARLDGHWAPAERFGLAGIDLWEPAGTMSEARELPGATNELIGVLEIEHGIAAWGTEMDGRTLPPEAMIENRGISYTKGCYVGQETIARIKSVGHVNKRLAVLRIESGEPIESGTDLMKDEEKVGTISRSAYSPLSETTLALGFLKRSCLEFGTILSAGNTCVRVVKPPREFCRRAVMNG